MRRPVSLLNRLSILIILLVWTVSAAAQNDLSQELRDKIDKLVNDTLAKSGVPSASVAIVQNGQIAFVKAYGKARLEPAVPATADMRYSIGSISKQFTATAILLLQERRSFRSMIRFRDLSRI